MERSLSRKEAQKPTNKGDEDHRIPDMLNTEDIKKLVGGNEQ